MRKAFWLATILTAVAAPVLAQDPVKVDAKHYKVEFENDQVRVLRITYGPGEKSTLHQHPGAVAVFLTDADGRFTLADGSARDQKSEAGSVIWTPAEKHQPENVGTKPFELILVEIKDKSAPKG
jgi:quercetin dioxygenase-like cupin family protein